MPLHPILCGREHIPEITHIINDNIVNSTSIYDYEPRSLEKMNLWLEAKEKDNYPVLGYIDAAGTLIGFGSYGPFRAWPAYKYAVEHSIYVNSAWKGQGYGKRLLHDLLQVIEQNGYHTTIGGIDSANTASIHLHKSLGFHYCGTIQHAGFKFGNWINLDFYQYIFTGPDSPTED